jgi:hypothetical protein
MKNLSPFQMRLVLTGRPEQQPAENKYNPSESDLVGTEKENISCQKKRKSLKDRNLKTQTVDMATADIT